MLAISAALLAVVAIAGAVVRDRPLVRIVAVLGVVLAAACSTAGADGAALGPGPVTVELRIEHSRFVPDAIRVRPGTEMLFVVVNDDPIIGARPPRQRLGMAAILSRQALS